MVQRISGRGCRVMSLLRIVRTVTPAALRARRGGVRVSYHSGRATGRPGRLDAGYFAVCRTTGWCGRQSLGRYVKRSRSAVARYRRGARRGRARGRCRRRCGCCRRRTLRTRWTRRRRLLLLLLLMRSGRRRLLLLLLMMLDRDEGRGRRYWRWTVLVEAAVHHAPPGHPGGISRSGGCAHRRDRARVAHAGAAQRRGVHIVVQRRRRASHVFGDGADGDDFCTAQLLDRTPRLRREFPFYQCFFFVNRTAVRPNGRRSRRTTRRSENIRGTLIIVFFYFQRIRISAAE